MYVCICVQNIHMYVCILCLKYIEQMFCILSTSFIQWRHSLVLYVCLAGCPCTDQQPPLSFVFEFEFEFFFFCCISNNPKRSEKKNIDVGATVLFFRIYKKHTHTKFILKQQNLVYNKNVLAVCLSVRQYWH